MNTLETVNIESPNGNVVSCAKFNVEVTSCAFLLNNIMTTGDTYTFGTWIKSDTAGVMKVGDNSFATSTTWQKFSTSFVAASERLSVQFEVAGNYYLYHAKLEVGNKATDWTPAPEDTAAAIAAAESKITQNADAIEAQVIETNGLKKRVSTVELTAEGLAISLEEVAGDAENAAKTATNFMSYDSTNGLQVGNKSSGSWSGFRTQITSSAFNILNSAGAIMASYGASIIELGKNSASAVVSFCNGRGKITSETTSINGKSYDSMVIEGTNAAEMRAPSVSVMSEGVTQVGGYRDTSYDPATFCGVRVFEDGTVQIESGKGINLMARECKVLDKYGTMIGNGLAAYESSGIDPDTTKEAHILTNKNTPMGTGYFMHILTFFYDYKSANANRSQLAIPYNNEGSVYHRYYASGEWSSWRRHYNSFEGSLELSGATPYIDFHYGNSGDDYTSRIIATANGRLQILGGSYGLTINTSAGAMAPTTAGGISLGTTNEPFYILRTQNSPAVVSVKEAKENIRPFTTALCEIEKTDVFNYNLKACLEKEGEDIEHTGFVIGEDYNISELLLSHDGNTIDLYNSIGVAFGGIKELHEVVKNQQTEIDLLKEQIELLKTQMNLQKEW